MRGDAQRMPKILDGEDAPIWTRDYSDGVPSQRACAELGRALDMLHARRMVVGHTVQAHGITSACDKKIWRIDVGLAKHYGGKPSVLEIRQSSVRPLTEETAAEPAPSAAAAYRRGVSCSILIVGPARERHAVGGVSLRKISICVTT